MKGKEYQNFHIGYLYKLYVIFDRASIHFPSLTVFFMPIRPLPAYQTYCMYVDVDVMDTLHTYIVSLPLFPFPVLLLSRFLSMQIINLFNNSPKKRY